MNSSSWDSYYIVFLSAIISLAIPASLALISFLLFSPSGKKRPSFQSQVKKSANQTILGERINVRFFLASNAALILIALTLELVPCVLTLRSPTLEGMTKGLVSIVTLAGFALLGLLYSVRKGDMGWLSTFHTEAQKNLAQSASTGALSSSEEGASREGRFS